MGKENERKKGVPAPPTDPDWQQESEEDSDRNSSKQSTSESCHSQSVSKVEEDDDMQEDPSGYKIGGYHPVSVGDVFEERYQVIHKLGWGQFSTVWRCLDSVDSRYVAVKVNKSADNYTKAALREIKLLECARDSDRAHPGYEKVVRLYNQFDVSGVNGKHLCLVFEELDCNLLELMERNDYRGLSMRKVLALSEQVLRGLAYLHNRCRIIHTDLKLENVLLLNGVNQNEAQLKIVDLGSACWTYQRLAKEITTRPYRSLEVIVGADYGTSTDIWSTACMIFELATGDCLFEPKEGKSYSIDDHHLACIIIRLGAIPSSTFKDAKFWYKYFDKDGNLLRISALNHRPLDLLLNEKYGWDEQKAKSFAALLTPMLVYKQLKRASAEECLRNISRMVAEDE